MSESSYKETVSGIGPFVFRQRKLRDQIRIEGEADRILGGPVEDKDLRHIALAMGTLIVLTVEAPQVGGKAWNVEALDPLSEGDVAQLWKVYGVLRAAEDRFRSGSSA